MDENEDSSDLGERLDRIESQMRQIKLLLGAFLVIAMVGLPGAVTNLLEAGMVALLITGALLLAWVGLYLLDLLLLRRLREKREKEMEQQILDAFRRSQAAEHK